MELTLKYNANSEKLKVELDKLKQIKDIEMKKLQDTLNLKNKEISIKKSQKKK